MIFTAHHFAFFVYSSLSLPNDMSIPAPTIARTPRRRTIFTNQRTIVAIIPWKEVSHFPTLHSYFGVGVPGAHSLLASHFVHPAIQVQPAQGTYSEVCTLTVLDVDESTDFVASSRDMPPATNASILFALSTASLFACSLGWDVPLFDSSMACCIGSAGGGSVPHVAKTWWETKNAAIEKRRMYFFIKEGVIGEL